MDPPPDAEIVQAVLAGNRDAYASLVERYQRQVFGLLVHAGSATDLSEELTQEAFVRAYYALPRYNPAYRFSTWVCQIALNLWRSERRKQWRVADVRVDSGDGETDDAPEWPDQGPTPDAAAETEDLHRRLWAAVAALPADAREIVLLRHTLELSYEDISATTGIPMGTVKSRLARARRQLALVLEDLVDGPNL
jgi:RNA polymerase sigma-70 factor (ECF subfamily)